MSRDKLEFEAMVEPSVSASGMLLLWISEPGQRLVMDALGRGAHRCRIEIAPVEPELKPCPFCGGDAFAAQAEHGSWYVECCECPGACHSYLSKGMAVAVWNRRAGVYG